LSCVLFRAHGKEDFCHALFTGRKVNKLFAVRLEKRTAKILFDVRFLHDARQSILFPRSGQLKHRRVFKKTFAMRFFPRRTANL
jgi:hypothetical protein